MLALSLTFFAVQDANSSSTAASDPSDLTAQSNPHLVSSTIVSHNSDQGYKPNRCHIRNAHGIHDDFFDNFTSVDNGTLTEELDELPFSFRDPTLDSKLVDNGTPAEELEEILVSSLYPALESKSGYELEPPVNYVGGEVTDKTTAKPAHPCTIDFVFDDDKTSAVESKSPPAPTTTATTTNIARRESEPPLDKMGLTSEPQHPTAFKASIIEPIDSSNLTAPVANTSGHPPANGVVNVSTEAVFRLTPKAATVTPCVISDMADMVVEGGSDPVADPSAAAVTVDGSGPGAPLVVDTEAHPLANTMANVFSGTAFELVTMAVTASNAPKVTRGTMAKNVASPEAKASADPLANPVATFSANTKQSKPKALQSKSKALTAASAVGGFGKKV